MEKSRDEQEARWAREEEKRQKNLLFKLKQNMGSMSDEEIEDYNGMLSSQEKFTRPSDTEK